MLGHNVISLESNQLILKQAPQSHDQPSLSSVPVMASCFSAWVNALWWNNIQLVDFSQDLAKIFGYPNFINQIHSNIFH